MTIEALIETPLLRAIGWAVVHSLWQGALIAWVAGALLIALRNHRAQLRYLVSCTALVLMFTLPIATILVYANPISESVPAAAARLLNAQGQAAPALHIALPVTAVLWFAGAFAFQCRAILQFLRARRLLTRGTTAATDDVRCAVQDLVARLKVRQHVEVVASTLAKVPMVIGWLNPVIVLPVASITGLTTDQLRSIIAHELAHVARHDYLVNLLQIVIEGLMFYHPAVWWLSQRIRVEREYCCDDAAVEAAIEAGGDAVGYARALALLETCRPTRSSLAMLSTGGSLLDRVSRLVGARQTSARTPTGGLPALLLTLIVLLGASSTAVTLASTPSNTTSSQDFDSQGVPASSDKGEVQNQPSRPSSFAELFSPRQNSTPSSQEPLRRLSDGPVDEPQGSLPRRRRTRPPDR